MKRCKVTHIFWNNIEFNKRILSQHFITPIFPFHNPAVCRVKLPYLRGKTVGVTGRNYGTLGSQPCGFRVLSVGVAIVGWGYIHYIIYM